MSAVLEAPTAPGPRARLASWSLRLSGWKVTLAQPVPRKCVIVCYPHTSNWDFPIGLLAVWATGLGVRWVGKDSLFRTPFAWFFEHWGGIPVKRGERSGFIGQMTEVFGANVDFRLVIAPEGTRRRTDHWKSGFYHLARAAAVPLGLGFIDYPAREVGVGAWTELTGDVPGDMARLAAFYADKRGRRHELAAPVRLGPDAPSANGFEPQIPARPPGGERS